MNATHKALITALLLSGSQLAMTAHAASEDYKAATARYAADKKLCAEETSSGARMQCLRDAKAEYDKAVAASGAATAPRTSVACKDCGKVLSVSIVEKKGEGGPIGVIAGGVAGALLGNQVGGGTGKTVATVAGAAGGAYAGHKVEEHVRSSKAWSVKVRLDGGEERSFSFAQDPGYKTGDLVKLSGNSIVRR